MTLSGRGLLALGCVVAVAVTVGIVGAVLALGGLALFIRPAPQSSAALPTPTTGYTQSMKPMPGRISVANPAGYPMVADEEGARRIAAAMPLSATSGAAPEVQTMLATGDAFYLSNGTNVQILQISGSLGRVQVMDGPHKNRSGWLPVNAVGS